MKSLIFILVFLVNIGIEIQDGAVSVEAGVKACAYSNEYDDWSTVNCSACGMNVDDCTCRIVTACAYCRWQYCNGECQLVCQYCGDPYCYGNCQYQNVCSYCGQSGCSGSCQQQNDDCGETCNVCGGSLGGSLRRGKLRSSCVVCVCTEDDYNTGYFALTEGLFALLHPIAAAKFSSNATKSENKANEYELRNKKKGEFDAFRHAYWCALNVVSENETLARQAGYAHENTPTDPPQTSQEREMDLYNNEVGYCIGNTAKQNGWDEDRIVAEVLAMLGNGLLMTLY